MTNVKKRDIINHVVEILAQLAEHTPFKRRVESSNLSYLTRKLQLFSCGFLFYRMEKIMFKKKKMAPYLGSVTEWSIFDKLLLQYISGGLKIYFSDMGLSKIDIYVDWFEHIRCINVMAMYGEYFVDWQFYNDYFESEIFDDCEPEEPCEYTYDDCLEINILMDRLKDILNGNTSKGD